MPRPFLGRNVRAAKVCETPGMGSGEPLAPSKRGKLTPPASGAGSGTSGGRPSVPPEQRNPPLPNPARPPGTTNKTAATRYDVVKPPYETKPPQ